MSPRRLSPLALLFALPGCHGSLGSLASYADGHDPLAFAEMRVGQQVVVDARGENCGARTADAAEGVADGKGAPLTGLKWAEGGEAWTVRESLVDTEGKRVLLGIGNDDGPAVHWISLPPSGSSCVHAVDETKLASVKALVGKSVVFAPWRPECTEIQAAGQSPASLLFESDPGSSLPVTGATLAPAVAGAGGAPVPWLVFAKGALRVRSDLVATCFAAPDSEEAAPPASVRDYLRTTKAQCTTDKFQDKPHVACSTTVGTWEGTMSDDVVSLSLVRRTHGPLHFVGGKPVQRDAFAHAVVAVQLGTAANAREQSLYDAMRGAVQAALAGEGGLVRPTTPGDATATMDLYVGASKLTIAELATRETTEQTTYPDHQEQRPNPKKAEALKEAADAGTEIGRAESAIRDAEAKVQQAEEDKKTAEAQKRELIQECRERASHIDNSLARNLALAGCTGADVGINPDGGVPEARQALADARTRLTTAKSRKSSADARLASTPDTVTEWVMAPWSYKKRLLTRAVSVQLDVKVTPRGGVATEKSESVELTLEDYEVEADARHKVDGHAANRDIIQTPENLIPEIAKRLSTRLGTTLRTILTQEQQAAALRLFGEAGGEAAREEYRTLDALAFEAAGKRMKKAARRGSGTATPTGYTIPLSAVQMPAGGCLLVAVLAEDPQDASLILRTPSGSHADFRGKSSALVEICARDGAFPDQLLVISTAKAKVRWGAYLLGTVEQ